MAATDILIPGGHHYSNPNYNISNTTNNNNNNNITVDPWAGVTAEDVLSQLDSKFAHTVFPATFFLGVLMVVGAVGNAAVLYVYTCRVRGQGGTVTRFIQALAVFDLLSCCLAIPGEILDMRNNYTFGRSPLCKMVRTINLWCTLTSGITLIVVAIDRYKRICCPLKRQISPRGAATIVCLASLVAMVLSCPTAVIYGSRSVDTGHPLVKGADCSIGDRYVTTIIPLLYNGIQMLLFIIGFFILLILYIFIARRIWQHEHQRLQRRRSTHLGVMAAKIKGQRFPGSPSDVASSSPPTTELASPITLTPEEQKHLQGTGGDARKNIFFNNIEKLKSDTGHGNVPQDKLEIQPDDLADSCPGVGEKHKLLGGQGRTDKVTQGETQHRRCSSDPHNTQVSLSGGRRAQWRCHPVPGELAGSLPEMETCDRDSGIGADCTPPGSALPDTLNSFDRLSRPGVTEKPPPSGSNVAAQPMTSGDLDLDSVCTGQVQLPTDAACCPAHQAGLGNEKRISVSTSTQNVENTESPIFATDVNAIALKTLSTPVLDKVQQDKDCPLTLSEMNQNAMIAYHCDHDCSAPNIPLLKSYMDPEKGIESREAIDLKSINSQTEYNLQCGLESLKESRSPRVGGSCGDLASKKFKEPRGHRRMASSAASISRSEGDHMTVCSTTLSEDDGETEEEILADTKDGNSPCTPFSSPESVSGNSGGQKCSHSEKHSVRSALSLRARLANSTTNLLAMLVSNEKSVSEWDATLDICDIDMTPVRRSNSGKSHSSKRKPKLKLTEPRRASEGECVETSVRHEKKRTLAETNHQVNHETDKRFKSHIASENVDTISSGRDTGETVKRQSLTGENVPEGEKPLLTRQEMKDGEQMEKKVLFHNDCTHPSATVDGDMGRQENSGSHVQSDETTEEREASQDGEGKVSLRSRRRGSSFRGLRDLKFRRFTLKSDTPGIRRTTLILFLISLVYIVSFLPHLVMMTLKALRPHAVSGDGREWTLASNLIIRSYFLNSVANPFIYTFLSKNFVRRIRGSFSRWGRGRVGGNR